MSDEANTRKKIHMIAAILGTLKISKGVRGSDEVAKLESTIESAKTALEEKRVEDAKRLGKEAGDTLLACAALLPKTPRKMAMSQIKKICRY